MEIVLQLGCFLSTHEKKKRDRLGEYASQERNAIWFVKKFCTECSIVKHCTVRMGMQTGSEDKRGQQAPKPQTQRWLVIPVIHTRGRYLKDDISSPNFSTMPTEVL
ncbi:hypothetical protein TNCV_2015071 [Trichonephila clavipes]|nr:hypothetical protein TNCV_2015071 [Trichonephila clavipes]